MGNLFDSIAPRYDFLNHFLSAGCDIRWRRRAISLLNQYHPKKILDVATGTCDLAIAATSLKPTRIVGIDISSEMLKRGTEKINRLGLSNQIHLEKVPIEQLPYSDQEFDAVMVAFGVRNFANLEAGLKEMYRVLRSHGVAMILEFSRPRFVPLSWIYTFYFKKILPALGGLISKNRAAYEYLPSTVDEFPDGEEFAALLRQIGFAEIKIETLSLGIATIYLAFKKM